MNGSLKKQSFPRLLCSLWQERATGVLSLQQRLVEKKIYLTKGELIHSESNLLHETVGQHCMKEGLISQEQLTEALAASEERGCRIGEILIDKGWVDPTAFYNALQQLLSNKVVDCFLWTDGSYEFDDSGDRTRGLLPLNVDPFHVLVKGIQTSIPFERMREDITLVLNKPTRVTTATLPKWADGYLNTMSLKLLKAFHEPIKPRFVMQKLNIEEEAMLRIVYLFDVAGLIVNTDKLLSAEKAAELLPSLDTIEKEPAAEPEPVVELSAEQSKGLLDDVLALSLRLDNINHFELLNMPEEDATVTRVRMAFLTFLERFSLAHFQQGPLAVYRPQVENILLAGAEAFADLRDANSKTKYVDKLKAKRREEQEKGKKKPGAAFAISTGLLDAGSQFKEGLRFLEQRNYAKAVEFFEYTRDIDGREPLYAAYLAFAMYNHDNESNLLPAGEMFEQAIKAGSGNAKINMLYGKFLLASGDTKKGIHFLGKAATLKPKDLEIQRSFRLAKSNAEK